MTAAEYRDLILQMTDEEIEDLMLYFRLGLLCFLAEAAKADDGRPRD